MLGSDLGKAKLFEDWAANAVEATVLAERGVSNALAVDEFASRNLFGESDRIAARAATSGTRRHYAASGHVGRSGVTTSA